MADEDFEDFQPSTTPGYKISAAKTTDEYTKLDAEDESLARWKASLGLVPGTTGGDTSLPKLTVLTLELESPTLPPGKKVVLHLNDANRLPKKGEKRDEMKVVIKEGVEYNVRITFKVNHSIVSGVRYMQVVKQKGIKVDTLEAMLGSYGPEPKGEAYIKDFESNKSPSGALLKMMGAYKVRSRVIDDDGEIYADWEWSFTLAKEWAV